MGNTKYPQNPMLQKTLFYKNHILVSYVLYGLLLKFTNAITPQAACLIPQQPEQSANFN